MPTFQCPLYEEWTTIYIITTKKQQIRITVRVVGSAVNHSVTMIIYATDIPLTMLTIYANSVAALVIHVPVSQHALRATLLAKVKIPAPTCVRRLQQQQQQQQRQRQQQRLRQRHIQQQRLRRQRH